MKDMLVVFGVLVSVVSSAFAGDSQYFGFRQTVVGKSSDSGQGQGGSGTLARAAGDAEAKCMNYDKVYRKTWTRFQAANSQVVREDDARISVKFTHGERPSASRHCHVQSVYSSSTGRHDTYVCEVPVVCDVDVRTAGRALVKDDMIRLPIGNRWSCDQAAFAQSPAYAVSLASMVRWEENPHGTDGCFAYFQRFGTDLEKR